MLPLALGAAVNTRVLAVEVVLLTGRGRPLAGGVAFGGGAAVPLLLVAVLDLVVVGAAVDLASLTHAVVASAAIDLAAAAVLLGVALRLLWRSPSFPERHVARHHAEAREPDLCRLFMSGAGVMASDISTMAMFVTLAKDIAVARVGFPWQALVLVLALAIALVTAWGPPALYAIRPDLARRVLGPVGKAARRHARAVTGLLVGVVGVYLALRGLLAL